MEQLNIFFTWLHSEGMYEKYLDAFHHPLSVKHRSTYNKTRLDWDIHSIIDHTIRWRDDIKEILGVYAGVLNKQFSEHCRTLRLSETQYDIELLERIMAGKTNTDYVARAFAKSLRKELL